MSALAAQPAAISPTTLQQLETNLQTLTSLDLNGRNIGPADCAALAKALTTNRVLRVLNLNSTRLGNKGVQIVIKALKGNAVLKELFLSCNSIKGEGVVALAEMLRTQEIHVLDLSGNPINEQGAALLAGALKANRALQRLTLRGCHIGKAFGAFAHALETNCTLHSLDVSWNFIHPHAAADLANALLKNHTLRTLHINNTNIGKIGSELLLKALEQNSTLTCMRCENSNIPDATMRAITTKLTQNKLLSEKQAKEATAQPALAKPSEAVSAPMKSAPMSPAPATADSILNQLKAKVKEQQAEIQRLHDEKAREKEAASREQIQASHQSKQVQKDPSSSICVAALAAAEEILSIKELTAEVKRLRKDVTALQLALKDALQAAQVRKRSRSLSVKYRREESEVDIFIRRLQQNDQKLKKIKLNGSTLSAENVKALAAALKDNTALTWLNLQHMRIGRVGAIAIAGALANNRYLVLLDLARNEIDPEGGEALAEALMKNNTLQKLRLSHNPLGAGLGKVFLDSFQKNKSLLSVDMIDTGIKQEHIALFEEWLKLNAQRVKQAKAKQATVTEDLQPGES